MNKDLEARIEALEQAVRELRELVEGQAQTLDSGGSGRPPGP